MKIRVAIISLLLAILCGGVGYFLYDSIHNRWYEKVTIKRTETEIKTKLKIIREAQKAFYVVNQRYCGHWDTLTTFLQTGNLYVIERSENIQTLYYYDGSIKGDSVIVKLDTLGSVSVRDSLFSKEKYPKLHIPTLRKVPHPKTGEEGFTAKDFEIYAGSIERGLKVFEVKDPNPINPERVPVMEGELPKKQPLSIGHRSKSSLKGSWEK